jgi:hypothetical protein
VDLPPVPSVANSPQFEIDGNLFSDTNGKLDWLDTGAEPNDGVIDGVTRASNLTCTGTSTVAANFQLGGPGQVGRGLLVCDGSLGTDLPGKNTPDNPDSNGFVQGQHEEEGPDKAVPPGSTVVKWAVAPATSPKKTDLAEVYFYSKIGDSAFDGDTLNDDVFFFVDATRLDVNGDFHVDFELNQAARTTCGDADPATVCQRRTAGDIIVSYDSAGGGQPPVATLYKYSTTAGAACASGSAGIGVPPGCYVQLTAPPQGPNGEPPAVGVFNTVEIPAPPYQAVSCEPVTGDTTQGCKLRNRIPAGGNMEGFIDLTAFVPNFDLCPGFGQVNPKSRSSSGISASLQDDVGALPVDISVCGSILLKKTDPSGALLGGAGFTVSPNPTVGGTGNLVVQDGQAGVDQAAAAGLVCIDNVRLGETFSVTESTVPAGYFGDNGTYSIGPLSDRRTCADRLTDDPLVPDRTFTNRLGSIIVTKVDGAGAALAGAGFTFSPDPFDGTGTVEVLDGSTTDHASAAGVVCVDDVRKITGSYTVTETTVPAGYFGDTATRTVTVSAPSTCAERLAGTVTPDASFTNLRGSLVIKKLAKNKAAGGTTLLGGVTFTITPNPKTGTGSLDVLDDDANDVFATDGMICIDGAVNPGAGGYTIVEKSAPTGYTKDPATKTVASASIVKQTCAARTAAATGGLQVNVTPDATFTNIPLSKFTVTFESLAGLGVTEADIACTDSAGNPLTLDGTSTDDVSEVYTNLEPNASPATAYRCTIYVDP